MIPNSDTPRNLSQGLTQLRLQLAVAFTGQPGRDVAKPTISFEQVSRLGLDAKEELSRRFSPSF